MVITYGMIEQKADVHQDAFSRYYSQLPSYYGLCYGMKTSNIYNMCKAMQVDRDGNEVFFGDRCFTIYKWFERLEAATGISRDKGLYKCELKNGQPIMMMVIACSETRETVPRPAARIDTFKRFLGVTRDPVVRRFNQPRVLCLPTRPNAHSLTVS